MRSSAHIEKDVVLAYHEAGHAVVAWRLSVPIYEVTVGPNGGSVRDKLGWRSLSPDWIGPDDREWARKTALILLGGEFAEKAYGFLNDCQTDCYGSDKDRTELEEVIKGLFGGFTHAAVAWRECMEDQVDQIVVDHWAEIAALATALISEGYLSESRPREFGQGDKW